MPAPAEFVQLKVWDWQDAIAAAPELRPNTKLLALVVTRYGSGLTGLDVQLRHPEVATLLGVGEATVRRRVSELVGSSYLRQTRRPARHQSPLFALFGPSRFRSGGGRLMRSTPITSERETDRCTPITDRRDPDRCAPVDNSGTPITSERVADRCAEANADQNRGVTPITTERERDHHKQLKQLSSSVQPTSEAGRRIEDLAAHLGRDRIADQRSGDRR